MHESAFTEVDAYMRELLAFLIEKQQVPFSEFFRIDPKAGFSQRTCITLRLKTRRRTAVQGGKVLQAM